MKRKFILSGIALGVILFFTGCSDDEKKANSAVGTWLVTDAAGVEWEEGTGVINTNDPDPEFIDETFTLTADEITIGTFGTFSYELADGVITVNIGGGETEVWNVEFDGSDIMYWTQDEPTTHADYEENNPGQFLYYQKSFTLEKQ